MGREVMGSSCPLPADHLHDRFLIHEQRLILITLNFCVPSMQILLHVCVPQANHHQTKFNGVSSDWILSPKPMRTFP